MSIRTDFQVVLNRLKRERADNTFPEVLNELEFADKEDYNKYLSNLKTGKTNDSTEIFIGGKKQSQEQVQKDLDKVKQEELQNYTKGIKGHTGKNPSEKSIKNDINNKINDVKEKLEFLDEDQKKETEKLIKGMTDFANAKTPQEKEKAIQQLVDDELIKRNNPGSGTVKIYIAAKTGLNYKEFGQNTALHQSITAYDQKKRNEGSELIPTQKKSNMGGKAMNPSGIYKDKEGNVMVTKIGIKKIENGINVGGVDVEKNPDPLEDKEFNKQLKAAYTENGKFNEKEFKEAIDAIRRNNKIVDEVETVLSKEDLDVIDPLPGTKPDTPENAKKVGNAAIAKTSDKLEEMMLANSEDKNLTKDQKEIVDKMRNLQKLDGEEFEKEILIVAALIAKNPATDSGFSDMCESFSYMSELKKGRAAYLPKGGNFPLGDLVSIENGKITDEDLKDPEKLRQKIKILHTNVENRSIKAKGGAASSSGKKAELSTYKEGKNQKTGETITGEEIGKDMQDINDDSYFKVWDGKDAGAVKEQQEKISSMAEKYGLDTNSPEYKKKKKFSIEKALAKIEKDRSKDPKKYPRLTAKEEKLLKMKLEAYYDMGRVFQKGYNENMDSQLFTNEDWQYDKKTETVNRVQTDGKCIISEVKFEFNVGFSPSGRPSNRVPTRFHNVDKCAEE